MDLIFEIDGWELFADWSLRVVEAIAPLVREKLGRDLTRWDIESIRPCGKHVEIGERSAHRPGVGGAVFLRTFSVVFKRGLGLRPRFVPVDLVGAEIGSEEYLKAEAEFELAIAEAEAHEEAIAEEERKEDLDRFAENLKLFQELREKERSLDQAFIKLNDQADEYRCLAAIKSEQIEALLLPTHIEFLEATLEMLNFEVNLRKDKVGCDVLKATDLDIFKNCDRPGDDQGMLDWRDRVIKALVEKRDRLAALPEWAYKPIHLNRGQKRKIGKMQRKKRRDRSAAEFLW